MSRRSSSPPSDHGNRPTPAPPASSGTSAAHSGSSSATAPSQMTPFCLLSELCANAVLHSDSGKTGGTFTVRAQHAVNRYVRGEVEDQGSDWHGDLSASATRPHGLYLLLNPGLGMRRRADRPRSRRLVPPRLPAPNPTGGQHVTTGHLPQPASRDQADRHLAAVAAGFTGHGISPRLSRIGDVPVLTIEEPTGGPDPTTVSINPDLSDPGLPLECTFLWTPPPGVPPKAIADTIIAVLNAVRPLAAAHGSGDEDTSPR